LADKSKNTDNAGQMKIEIYPRALETSHYVKVRCLKKAKPIFGYSYKVEVKTKGNDS